MPGHAQTIGPALQMATRRFDVFAEHSRQEQVEKALPMDAVKGYGVWIAKVVASRRFGKKADGPPKKDSAGKTRGGETEPNFRSVGDELQTDETFDHDVIERMGASFYDTVFVPAIEQARAAGRSYEDIRDSIRKGWNPGRKDA